VVSKYISNHARTLVTGRVELRHQKFSVLLMSLYKERDAELAQAINEDLTPAYGLLNAAVNWQFHKALGIYLQVNNLGNVRYSDVLGAQMPGRWFMGGVQFGF
jgi:iron complex outermembrane receptor protein